MHEDLKNEEEYVKKVTQNLKFAFKQAQIFQTTMAEKNQGRKLDNEYKPGFEPGDLLLVWEKASAESRLKKDVRRLQGDDGGILPGKLRNPWQGPFKMLRWSSERTCIIDRNGKEEEYNVNRLTKQYEWDADHPDTSEVMKVKDTIEHKEPIQKKRKLDTTTQSKQLIKVGHLIIFEKEIARGHRSPFGVGQVIEIRKDETLHFQWFGNYFYNANGAFQPRWMNFKEDLGYYGRKQSKFDVPWTEEHTEDTVTMDLVITSGTDLLTKDKKLSAKSRKAITSHIKGWEINSSSS